MFSRPSFLRASAQMVERGPIIGREGELAALGQLLRSARLVTVTGVGGCGKTRVAVELAGRAATRADPVEGLVVELAAVRSAEQVVGALLRALGVRERGGHSPLEVLCEAVGERRSLLVLDNCEHVIAEVGRVAGALLDGARGVHVLATSRTPLGHPGEIVFPLAPLGVPDAPGDVAAVVRSDAGRLFVDRAVAADPSFVLTPSTARAVARIADELDGLPLALSLAAARVGRLAPAEIADGLSRRGRLSAASRAADLPQHRSLRASLAWSYELLDEEERVVLRRLSAFAGGFTAGAARAVTLPEASETHVRALLDALEAKGLITPMPTKGEPRWALLNTVSEYAAERLALDDSGRDVRFRHLDWFRACALAADGLLLESSGSDLVEEQMPNLRLALEWAVENDASSSLDIVAGLTRHWILSEHFGEARTAADAALAAADTDHSATRAVVECGLGVVATLAEDYAEAIAHTQAGLALAAAHDGGKSEARCLQTSSMVLILTGMDLDEGLKSAVRAADLLRASGDRLGLAFALVTVAFAEGLCDRFDGVHTAYDEYRTIPGVSAHVRLETWAELAAAWAEVVVGSPAAALRHADRAIALEGDWPSMTHFVAMSHRVQSLAHLGRAAEAIDEGMEALASAERSGAAMAMPAIEMALVVAELADGRLAPAEARARRVAEVPQLHTAALMRESLARIALAGRHASEAAVHAEELAALAQRTGSPRQRAVADLLAGCAAALDGEEGHGRDLLHAALVVHEELGLERGTADVLEELAMLAAEGGDGARTGRLAGAAAAARGRLGCVPSKPNAERLEAVRAHFAASDAGAAAWETAWAEGASLPLGDAIAYARRSRGPRDRPEVGWSSLTPTERDVAQLAAGGMSNPQIAGRLFMSRSTVKMHLSSVYSKLRVANRTELARASAIRSVDGGQGQVTDAIAVAPSATRTRGEKPASDA